VHEQTSESVRHVPTPLNGATQAQVPFPTACAVGYYLTPFGLTPVLPHAEQLAEPGTVGECTNSRARLKPRPGTKLHCQTIALWRSNFAEVDFGIQVKYYYLSVSSRAATAAFRTNAGTNAGMASRRLAPRSLGFGLYR